MADAAQPDDEPQTHTATSPDGREHVCITHEPLDVLASLALVKDPAAGAVVMFAGTTRSTFAAHPVAHLTYTSYAPLALRTLASIAASVRAAHSLVAISLTHRLGSVPVGEESILVCVSAAHRGPAWRAGEEALEAVKRRVEVWKREVFEGGSVRVGRDGEAGDLVGVEGAERDAEGHVGVWRVNGEERGEGEGGLTGRELMGGAAEDEGGEIEEEGQREDAARSGHERHGRGFGHEQTDEPGRPGETRDEDEQEQEHSNDEHRYGGDEGERRRIAEESRREMEMEMEKGWGGA